MKLIKHLPYLLELHLNTFLKVLTKEENARLDCGKNLTTSMSHARTGGLHTLRRGRVDNHHHWVFLTFYFPR